MSMHCYIIVALLQDLMPLKQPPMNTLTSL